MILLRNNLYKRSAVLDRSGIDNLRFMDDTIFLLTGLRIYTGEYKAQGPTLCPTEWRALQGPRALYSPVQIRKPVSKKFIA